MFAAEYRKTKHFRRRKRFRRLSIFLPRAPSCSTKSEVLFVFFVRAGGGGGGGGGGGAEGDRGRIITSIKNTLDPRHAYLPSRNPPRHSGGADRIAGEVRGALPLPRRLAPVWPRRPCWPWHRCVGVPVSVGECLGEDGSTRLLAGASRAERVPVPPSRRPAAARCPRPLGHRGTGGIRGAFGRFVYVYAAPLFRG